MTEIRAKISAEMAGEITEARESTARFGIRSIVVITDVKGTLVGMLVIPTEGCPDFDGHEHFLPATQEEQASFAAFQDGAA